MQKMLWDRVKLSDVCEIIAGQSPESKYYNSDGNGLPFFQGKADFGHETPNIRYWCTQPTKIALKDDILLSVRAPVGPTNICNVESCIGRGLAAIRCSKKANSRYVYYWFKSNETKLASMGNGSTFSAVTTKVVKDLFIPLPPRHIQEQIANTLDKADALRRKDQELLTRYDELAQAIFYDMFGDPVKNEMGWDIRPIKQLGKVTTGNTPSRENVDYYGDYIEWIKSDNVTHDFDFPAVAKEYLSISGSSVGRSVEKGSILITCIAGSPVTIGNCVLTNRPVAFNQQINAFTPTNGQDLLFVLRLFRESKKLIQNSTTSGMKRIITKGEFEKLELINPPQKLQKDFGKKYEEISQARILLLKAIEKSKQVFETMQMNYFQS